MKSIWNESCSLPNRDSLKGDLVVDTIVIGAGMAGVLTAYLLQKEGKKVAVLEAAETASGVTGNTTAKITSQHNLFYNTLIQKVGQEQAKQYADANQKAIEMYRSIISENDIDCNLETKSAFVYSLDQMQDIEAETNAALSLGIPAEFTTSTGLPFEVKAAVKFPNQAQFHPLKFIQSISKDLDIYENTKALFVSGDSVVTNRGRVTADHIVIATHFPFLNVPGWYFARMHQDRSYVIALENAKDPDGMYIDADPNGYSFRSYDGHLLLGGGGHRSGKHPDTSSYEKLRTFAKKYYPDSREVCHWSAQDCVSWDSIPYIGRYSASTPHLFVVTGFKKWGMTSSMVAAMILSDEICGRTNENAEVFSPRRFNASASAKNLFTDVGQSVAGLTAGLFSPPKRRCAHLGCRVHWNPDEETWDCPCHGSRYTKDGELISNPAQKGLKSK